MQTGAQFPLTYGVESEVPGEQGVLPEHTLCSWRLPNPLCLFLASCRALETEFKAKCTGRAGIRLGTTWQVSPGKKSQSKPVLNSPRQSCCLEGGHGV